MNIGSRGVRRLIAKTGLSPICRRPRTSDPHPQHRIDPVSAAASGGRAAKPGLARRHHLHPDAFETGSELHAGLRR